MYQELLAHFPEEAIQLQTKFILQPSFCLDHSRDMQRALVYKSDFVLGKLEGSTERPAPGVGSMVLDAKGMVLPSFVVASKLFEYKFRMPVIAVKTVKQLKTYIEIYKMSTQANQEHVDILTSGRDFWVRGYVNSSGNRSDLWVRVIGREGYLALVNRSLVSLADWDEQPHGEGILVFGNQVTELFRVPAADVEDYRQAMVKVKESLEKKRSNGEEEGAARQSKEEFHALSPDLGVIGNDPQKLAVLRLQVVISKPDPEQQGVEAKPKKGVTKWRTMIETCLPISSYTHRLNLYPGKFDSLHYAE